MPARHLTRSFPVPAGRGAVAEPGPGQCLPTTTLVRFLALLLVIFPAPSLGVTTFERAWPFFNRNCTGVTVHQVADQGYIIGAYVSTAMHSNDLSLIRTDSLGDTLWTLVRLEKHAGYACQTADGNFVVVGDTESMLAAVKSDTAGRLLWDKTYDCYGEPREVAPTADGGLVAVSVSRARLLKLDSCGNASWCRFYPRPDEDYSIGSSVIQTNDRGYAATGLFYDTEGERCLFLTKVDSSGELEWKRTYYTWDDYTFREGVRVRQTPDHGYIVAGRAFDSLWDGWPMLVKFDSAGEIQWCRVYVGLFFYPLGLARTRDHGFIVSGHAGRAAGLIKTDSLGDTLWTSRFMPPFGLDVWGYCVEQTADGGYVMSGDVNYRYVYLVKTDSLGKVEVGLTEGPGRAAAAGGIRVNPNPCVRQATISVLSRVTEPLSLGVHDAAGRLVRTLVVGGRTATANSAVWDCADEVGNPVPAGIYPVTLVFKGRTIASARVVLLR